MKRHLVAVCAVFAMATCALAQSATRVEYTGPAEVHVQANTSARLPLEFTVEEGFHINSHTPSGEDLIPTRLAVAETAGVDMTAADFPPGHEYAFDFDPETKLSVYSGTFAIVAHVKVARGSHPIAFKLHYQACDNRTCYPPKDLPFAVRIVAQ